MPLSLAHFYSINSIPTWGVCSTRIPTISNQRNSPLTGRRYFWIPGAQNRHCRFWCDTAKIHQAISIYSFIELISKIFHRKYENDGVPSWSYLYRQPRVNLLKTCAVAIGTNRNSSCILGNVPGILDVELRGLFWNLAGFPEPPPFRHSRISQFINIM